MTQFYGLQSDTKKLSGLGKVKQEVPQALTRTSKRSPKRSIAECE